MQLRISIYLFCCIHVVPPLFFGELLNGIAEHGAGHVVGMDIKERYKLGFISLANLAKHPAYRLLHQVVRMMEETLRKGNDVVEIIPADEGEGGNHGDALVPQQMAVCQFIQYGMTSVDEIFPNDGGSSKVYKIPIVDFIGVRKIKIEIGFTYRFRFI